MSSAPYEVAGADGYRKGWVVVTAGVIGEALVDLRVERADDLADTVAAGRTGALRSLAIDMPIGLLDEHPRTADVEARALLGPRRSSVFPTPLRVTLDAPDYDTARTRSIDACGKALSKQAWNLLPKIRELDELITADDQPAIAEAHPECAFVRLQGDIPLDHAKSTDAGAALRIGLLRASRRFVPTELHAALTSKVAPVTDIVDALALVITARHMANWTEERLGDQTDVRGRRAEIVY